MAIKTTVRLDETIVKEAKRKALDEDKTFQEVVDLALREFLNKKISTRKVSIDELTAYPLEVKGNLKREDLYKDYLEIKFPARSK